MGPFRRGMLSCEQSFARGRAARRCCAWLTRCALRVDSLQRVCALPIHLIPTDAEVGNVIELSVSVSRKKQRRKMEDLKRALDEVALFADMASSAVASKRAQARGVDGKSNGVDKRAGAQTGGGSRSQRKRGPRTPRQPRRQIPPTIQEEATGGADAKAREAKTPGS